MTAEPPFQPAPTAFIPAIYETLSLATDQAAAVQIILNRPEKHNAFNARMIAELADAFDAIAGADGVRVVFLTGAGKAFSAGGDLDWMREQATAPREQNEADGYALASMLAKLHRLPKLTVALVNGAAMGGGLGLVAACDAAVAVRDAQFRFSEVRLGLTPATISPFVIEKIGPGAARGLFASGEGFGAERAQALGLVTHLSEDAAGLDPWFAHYAQLAMEAAPGAVAAAKALVREVAGHRLDDGLARLTAARIAEARAGAEGREGLAAFLEKRAPAWT